MSNATPDPLAFYRTMLSEWERMTNEFGSAMLQRPETVQALQGATTRTIEAQRALHELMAKALSVANMPSKADIDVISGRLAGIEAALARIENGTSIAAADVPRPTRMRTPPTRS